MTSSPAEHPRSRMGWAALRALLGLESLMLVWVLIATVLGALGSTTAAVQNLSLVAMAALSLVWVAVTFAGSLRARVSWVRGSALTIHVLLFAAGTGCLQLAIGPWWFGFALVAAALLGFLSAVLARPELPENGSDSVTVS
ncbi:hypothetical protein [Leucobacter triazinivorans]|uniref:DUF2568 domain-containing protein n=1 Tax=Leucobacter triazinivorans TaxID=1784719 RepID=A0A4P6KCA8_9MICO|nr:hypothetical protein [Leucobacter triazinivorans]QBE47802.1 hypothetical protein EVS81_02295 [Leucobacter triazinivorans]